METNFEHVLNTLSEKIKGFANTETVIGDEFKLGEFTCKPIIKIGLGFGTGEGEGDKHTRKSKGHGRGAGGGIGIAPVGFLVTKEDEISFVSADQKKGLSAVFEKVPDLMEKMMDIKKKKEEEAGT
jgi:uncharacterized spore protein YtfJ